MPRSSVLRRRLTALACATGLLWPALALAIEEAELKAAIVFNILLFVEWPASVLPEGSDLVMCVAPQAGLSSALKKLAGRDLRGHRLEVRDMPPAAPRSCRVLYVESAERTRLGASLAALSAAGTLVLSDDADAPRDSTAIVLQRAGNKFVFDVRLQPVRTSQVQLSSKLLRLAREVIE